MKKYRPEGFDVVEIMRKSMDEETIKELENIMGDAGLDAFLSVTGESLADAILEALRKSKYNVHLNKYSDDWPTIHVNSDINGTWVFIPDDEGSYDIFE